MPFRTIADIVLALAAAFVAFRIARSGLRYSGRRVITCPENSQPAGVRVDAARAALTGVLREPELRLSECSRWPEHAGCGQEGLRQIEASPEGCLMRHILDKWYEGKNCFYCGRAIETPAVGSTAA